MNYLLRLTSSDIQIRGMAHLYSLRHPLFRRRWFTDEVIISCDGVPENRILQSS
jgi:hypothetical protein